MSSSSYLGHGAKYWADRYFELQTQTRMPDDYSSIEWREKYLSLEKDCAAYQATLADLRTEVEYLHQKSTKNTSLSDGRDATYLHSEYLKAENEIIRKEKVIKSSLEKNRERITQIRKQPDSNYEGHSAKYWYDQFQAEKTNHTVVRPILYQNHDAEYWYNLGQNKQASDLVLINKLEKDIDTLTTNSFLGGHDIEYWHTKATKIAEPASRIVIFIFTVVTLFIVFMCGKILGEGYFAPHYTPISPYIDSVQKESEASGYDKGYDAGYYSGTKDGYSEAYRKGKTNGYEQGYSDGLNRRTKDISRWTAGDAAALREGLSNANK